MKGITAIVIMSVATALLASQSFFGGDKINYIAVQFSGWLIIFLFIFIIFWHLPLSWHPAIRSIKEVIYRRFIELQRVITNADDRRALRDKDPIITGLLAELSTLNNAITEKNQQMHNLGQINKTLKENIDRLRSDVETLKASRPIPPSVISDRKFISVKREFAKMYHPNNPGFTGMEKVVRGELFKEFWQVLERIEAT
jgi:hypothetical protein